MATVDVKLVLTIYSTEIVPPEAGVGSVYSQVPHPATGKKIQGWKWDERPWSDTLELKATDYVPSVFDPDTNFLPEEAFQSGMGDNDDLKLIKVSEQQISNIRYWVPRIHHGYFYDRDEEWYLYSEDIRKDIVESGVLISGVLQYKDLSFNPKPGVPIMARRYKWDRTKSRYDVDLAVRKKIEFTGLIDDQNEEQDTQSGTDYNISNIDTSQEEFLLDYEYDPPRAVFNQLFSDHIGMSGQFDTLDFLGFGGQKNEYHLTYSPVDTSQTFHLITWDPATEETLAWSQLESVSEFPTGSGQYFKLDPYLGIVSFGNYDPTTTSGAGMVPPLRHKIGAAYTYGVDLTYEPEFTRDWIEPITGDVNPLHNVSHQGFLEVSPNEEGLFSVHLFTEMLGSAAEGYIASQAAKHYRVFARVKDGLGNRLEHQRVEFEILSPTYGVFSNSDTSIISLTNENGLATVYYVTPQVIEEISHTTTQVVHQNDNTTRLAISNMLAPADLEQVYLYKVRVDDPVGGIPSTSEDAFYQSFFNEEPIEENPNGTVRNKGFEVDYREGFNLLEPAIVPITSLDQGTKYIVSGVDTGVLDPSYSVQRVGELAPLIPFEAITAGSVEEPVLELQYSGLLDNIDNTTFKSYLLITDPATRIRAKVVNEVTQQTVYSNVINIDIPLDDASRSVKSIYSINEDLPSGVLKLPKNVDNYSSFAIDDFTWLNQHSKDILTAEYAEDALVTISGDYVSWSGDTNTIGYWPLDGSLLDFSSYGNNLQNHGAMVTAIGLLNSGYRSTGGYQYLESPDIYNTLNLQSGTIDFLFKTGPYPEGSNDYALMQITATGTNGLRNNLSIMVSGQTSDLPLTTLYFNYEVSGIGIPTAVATYRAGVVGGQTDIFLNDGLWHSVRATWNFEGWESPTNLFPENVRTAGHNGTLNGFSYVGVTQTPYLASNLTQSPPFSLAWPNLTTGYIETETVSAVPSGHYVGSMYVYLDETVNPSTTATLALISDAGTIDTVHIGAVGSGLGTEWQRIEVSGVAPDNTTSLKLRVAGDGSSSTQTLYMDNFQLERHTRECNNLFPQNVIRATGKYNNTNGFTAGGGAVIGPWTAAPTSHGGVSYNSNTLYWVSAVTGEYIDTDFVAGGTGLDYVASVWVHFAYAGSLQLSLISDVGTIATKRYDVNDLGTWHHLIVAGTAQANASEIKLRITALTDFFDTTNFSDFSLERGTWPGEFQWQNALAWANPGGNISLTLGVDNKDPNDGFETYITFAPEPGTTQGGYLGAVVGDLTSSGNFTFDEVRYSNNVRTDSWPPAGEQTITESFSDWFKRTHRADSETLHLLDVVNSGYAPARLPFGFRLKSDETTVASKLDTTTFLILNDPMPSGYYG